MGIAPGGAPLPLNRAAAAARTMVEDAPGALFELGDSGAAGRLAARFVFPPFGVFDARQGEWAARKRLWLSLGIRSEIGRGADASPGGSPRSAADYSKSHARGDGHGAPMADLRAHRRQAITSGDVPIYANGSKAAPAFADTKAARGARLYGDPARNPGFLPPSSGRDSTYYEQKNAAQARIGRLLTNDEFEHDHYVPAYVTGGLSSSGTSVFDPVLCELAYRWFAPQAGRVLDPFAGGSVRGIVAAMLGRSYTGIDLSAGQVAANRDQATAILSPRGISHPAWHVGDALDLHQYTEGRYDLLFSCPPYGSLEVYSDDPRDISTMPPDLFDATYAEILRRAIGRLHDDRFVVLVVANYRAGPYRYYRDLCGLSVRACEAAGAGFYNDGVLVTPVGSLPVRIGKQFEASRKLGKTHQNILVFCKGDPRKATAALGAVSTDDVLMGTGGQLALDL